LKSSSDFLWRLIHSLSSREKLFFKRNFSASASPGQKLYIKLFDAIAGQKKYDEAAIIRKLAPGMNSRNIAFQKYYLQNQIGEAIIHYDGRNNQHHEIYKQIMLIRLYRKKGLPDEAHAVWKKTMAKARQLESFALISLLKSEFEKILLFSNLSTHYDDLHAIFKGNVISYDEYAEMITLRDIYTETLLLKKKAHFDFDNDLKKRIEILLERVNRNESGLYGRSFWFRHYYYMNKATLLYLLNETGASLGLLQQAWLDWKKHEQFIGTDGEFYIELMYMINYAGILNQSFQYVEDTFNHPLNEQIKEPAQKANFEVIKYLALNKIYNKTARYDKVEKLVSSMKLLYPQWEPELNSDMNRTANLSLGIGCFVLENYSDALYFIKRGLNWYREGAREEHSAIGHILLLLASYNLNNSRIFDAQYRSTYSYFYKRKKKHPFETALVQCLHRTFYMKDNKTKTEEFKKTLEVFEKNKNDVIQQMAFSIFNYPGWLISKVQRIPYRRYVEQKVLESRV
jgi:hypothetical protein